MFSMTSSTYCQACNKPTSHKEMLVRKPSSYDTEPSLMGKIKLFAHTFINGGHYYDMDRYITCQDCGKRTLENKGKEFE
ncbi:hypothetical protein ACP3V5_03855 [Vibrio maritimus]